MVAVVGPGPAAGLQATFVNDLAAIFERGAAGPLLRGLGPR